MTWGAQTLMTLVVVPAAQVLPIVGTASNLPYTRTPVFNSHGHVSSVSASACQIGGPNSVNPGQILLVYGINLFYDGYLRKN